MMKNRAKVIKKNEICKQMPILLSINKNYFHYSNIICGYFMEVRSPGRTTILKLSQYSNIFVSNKCP